MSCLFESVLHFMETESFFNAFVGCFNLRLHTRNFLIAGLPHRLKFILVKLVKICEMNVVAVRKLTSQLELQSQSVELFSVSHTSLDQLLHDSGVCLIQDWWGGIGCVVV